MVVLAKEPVFLDKPEDHLSKKFPQKWPSFLRDPVLPAESAALIHANVQASMPQELLVVLEVAQGAGFSEQAGQIDNSHDPFVGPGDGRVLLCCSPVEILEPCLKALSTSFRLFEGFKQRMRISAKRDT